MIPFNPSNYGLRSYTLLPLLQNQYSFRYSVETTKNSILSPQRYIFPNDNEIYISIKTHMYKCSYLFSSLSCFLSYIPGSITALWISYESLKPKTMESYLILSTKSNGCCLQVYVSYSQFARQKP